MVVVTIQGVSKQFDGQVVLEGVSVQLHSGHTVGLVGVNGAGKTTLFRLVAGLLRPDSGTVTLSKGLQIGYLTQEPQFGSENTLHQEVGGAFADLLVLETKLHTLSEQMAKHREGSELQTLMAQYDRVSSQFAVKGGYSFVQRLNEVLGGLGFSPSDYDLPMRALSGGQVCRAALARLLLQDRQFLLLDEPTNHLDIDAIRWLEKFLAGYHGGAVIVSHDRYFLDRLADRIVEIDGGRLAVYPGNYTNYVQVKKTRLITQQRQYEKDTTFIQKEKAFIAKHLAGQRSKEAKGRRTRLQRRMSAGEFVMDTVQTRSRVKFSFDLVKHQGTAVLRTEGLAKGYGDKQLFSDLGLQVQAGQRLGITGPNGVGKTTLLRVLLGETPPDAGSVEFGPKIAVGYYAQEVTSLNLDRTVLDEVRELRPDWSEQDSRSYLGQFQFTGDDAFKQIGQLSGGEQSRIRLIKLLLASSNLLVLDEPTNHLDIPSREALEEALAQFPGTIIAVSHDRYFLDRLVDNLLVLHLDRHAMYAGNYSFYIKQVEQEQVRAKDESSKGRPSRSRRGAAKGGKQAQDVGSKQSPYDRLTIDELESLIEEREQEISQINARFAEPEVYRDREATMQLRRQLDGLKGELSEIEQAWHERIDNA